MQGEHSQNISSNQLATLFPNQNYFNSGIDPYYQKSQSQQQNNNNQTQPLLFNAQQRNNHNQSINIGYNPYKTKVSMIYANTYTKNFSQKELQILKRFLEFKGKIPWTKVQHILYKQCGQNHPLPFIRKQWALIVKQNSPSKQNIFQYINKMLDLGMAQFTTISNQLIDTPFVSVNYAQTFFKYTYIKIMKGVQNFIGKYFFKRVDRLSHESKKRISKNLVSVNYSRLNSVRLTLLRYFLLHIYLNKLSNIPIIKNDIMVTYSMMCNVNQEYITQQKEINCRGRLSFAWSIQQLRQLYDYYRKFGAYSPHISRLFILKYGESQKFVNHAIDMILSKLIRQSFFISIKDRKDYIFSYKLSANQVPKLKLRKCHPKFYLIIRLIGCFFGQQHSNQQMNQVYDFIGQLLLQSSRKIKGKSNRYAQDNRPRKKKEIKIDGRKRRTKLRKLGIMKSGNCVDSQQQLSPNNEKKSFKNQNDHKDDQKISQDQKQKEIIQIEDYQSFEKFNYQQQIFQLDSSQ